ncbi:anion permease [Eudoraea adriatica]|uniref:anion permease n=1 Tax=Eudoraea adriatica TaxID=446681 RepID=UPI000375007E
MLPAIEGLVAFMLPVATPPNAIVYGSKRISVIEMAKTGFFLNIIGIILVSVLTYYFGIFICDTREGVFPEWA